MKEARDIAWFSISFTVGVLAATCTVNNFHDPSPALAAMMSCISMLPATLLIHPAHTRWDSKIIFLLAAIAAFACGVLCGTTGAFTAPFRIIGRTESMALALGQSMEEAIDRMNFTHPETGAIIKALLTGDRGNIPKTVTEAFRNSGASHILALSGLHLGIIYTIVSKAFALIGNSPLAKRTRSVAIILICGTYTMATGAGASISRAFLFIFLGEIARLSGRKRDIRTVLLSALMIQLAISPQSAKSVGFQLSYAAMSGIAYIYPWLRNFWPDGTGKGITKRIWESAAMSVACQITTGPLAWIYFRSFPQHFLLTNLMALPLTGIIIPMALMSLVLDLLGICPEIMLKATEALVQALSAALEIISTM